MRHSFAIVLFVSLIPSAVAQTQLPEPLGTAIAPNETLPSFTFDIERTSTDTGEDGETRTGYARVDLRAAEFKQITPAHLINPNSPGSSFSALAGIENALADGVWCSSLISTPPDPEDVEVIAEDADTITYQFKPGIGEDADGPEKKMAKKMLSTVVVSREDPAILSFEQHLTKPVTLYVVAKIRSIDLTATCARGPDGNTYIQETSNAFEASGLGDSGGNDSSMKITAIYDAATGTQLASN